ncbi:hypothetical protein Hanom_Chr07g00621371 [Helianthus anomalus]
MIMVCSSLYLEAREFMIAGRWLDLVSLMITSADLVLMITSLMITSADLVFSKASDKG